jgi:uncharacterized membrane protein YbhN (UPF0104 family)
MQSRRIPIYWISAAVIAIVMVVFLRSKGIQFSEIGHAIGQYPVKRLVEACFFIAICQLPVQASRLWTLLPRPRTNTWWGAASGFFFGQAINAFAPARAGDAVKVVILNRESAKRLSISAATGVLLSDKLIDVISFALLCAAAARSWSGKILKFPLPALRTAALGLVVIIALVGGASALLPKFRERLIHLYKTLASGIREGLAPLQVKRQVSIALLFSIFGWIGELLAVRCLCLGQGYDLSMTDLLWPILVLNIGVAVPVAVANIGAFEASMAFGLSQVGVPLVEGLAIASVHHLLQIVGTYLWTGALAVTRPRWTHEEPANLPK